MKDFVKMVFASAIGFLIANAVMVFMLVFGSVLIVAITAALSPSSVSKNLIIKDETVLKITLKGQLLERPVEHDPLKEYLMEDSDPNIGLYNLRIAIREAAKDKRIVGVVLRFKSFSAGWANLETLRNELVRFKQSGKFIYAYGEYYSEKSYYLASISNRVYLFPEGGISWDGLGGRTGYLKNTFKKFHIEPLLVRAGSFKAAAESFVNSEMSKEQKLQMEELLGGLWGTVTEQISKVRGELTVDGLNNYAQNLSLVHADDAAQYGFVDELLSGPSFELKVKEELGRKADEDIHVMTWKSYKSLRDEEVKSLSKDKIAVLIANGTIYMGKGPNDEGIYSENLVKALRKIGKSKKIKAVVLRINSGGGSALASDVIWHAIEDLKSKGIRVVTSFGDVAASGGYYIAAGTDYIFAEPTTITGSIGVFGLLFQTDGFFKNYLDMNFSGVKTHDSADMNSGRQLTSFEVQKIQKSVNKVYERFLEIVFKGRSKKIASMEDLESIAGGRVWTGVKALDNGLVDSFGSLTEAIEKASELSGLKEYKVVLYPERKKWVEKILDSFNEVTTPDEVKKWTKFVKPFKELESISKDRVQSRWLGFSEID